MAIDYSIIIPAYNEQELLPATLQSARGAMAVQDRVGELIVVDNNSTDATAAIAAQAGARVVFEAVNQISRARNAGAKAASGRYLVFLDADTPLPAELLRQALTLLDSGQCCGGGVLVAGDTVASFFPRLMMALWNRISLRFGFAAGCFVFCLRAGYDAAGGFSEQVYASEEIWFSRRLRAWGRKQQLAFTVIAEPMIVTSMRKLVWYTPAHMLAYFLLFSIFPPAVRFRRLCSPWYKRPVGSKP